MLPRRVVVFGRGWALLLPGAWGERVKIELDDEDRSFLRWMSAWGIGVATGLLIGAYLWWLP